MPETFPLMVPGAKPGGSSLKVCAPYDGKYIADCETADMAAAEHALTTAHRLYRDRDAWLPLPQRLEILSKAADIIESRVEELALESAREGGKPLLDSKVEVVRAVDSVRSCVETMRTESGSAVPMNLNASSSGKLAVTRREPIGVVVAVSAFNHPVNLIAHQVGPAVAAGCPFIVKPATDTPLSCLRFVKILHEAGLPPEWGQAVVAPDRSVAAKLVTDARVAFFSFIGSAELGWKLRSKLAPGTRCALEHGGIAPVILAADADVEAAVVPLGKGGFYHAGQVCVSVQRIYAHESIAKRFADKLTNYARALKVGDPTKPGTEVGPLIRHEETDRVHKWVTEAVDVGGKLLCGGRKISDSCYEPTVLFDPPDEARVSSDEVFGPVVCVYPYSDLDDAIRRANSLPFSFQAAVYTKDLNTAMRCFARLDGSAIMVNEHTAFRVDWMPFAGLKHSGYGVGGIPYTLHDMQIEKMLVIRSDELKQ